MIIYYLLFSGGLAALLLWGRADIKRFLTTHAAVDDAMALDAFKSMARRNMIGALIYLPLGIVALMWSFYIVWNLLFVGVVLVLSVHVPIYFLSINLRRLEHHARSLDCGSVDLKEQHQRISETWIKKVLPDF